MKTEGRDTWWSRFEMIDEVERRFRLAYGLGLGDLEKGLEERQKGLEDLFRLAKGLDVRIKGLCLVLRVAGLEKGDECR